jgi:hypothetical protein
MPQRDDAQPRVFDDRPLKETISDHWFQIAYMSWIDVFFSLKYMIQFSAARTFEIATFAMKSNYVLGDAKIFVSRNKIIVTGVPFPPLNTNFVCAATTRGKMITRFSILLMMADTCARLIEIGQPTDQPVYPNATTTISLCDARTKEKYISHEKHGPTGFSSFQ